MLSGLIGRKIEQTQAFLEDGKRVPLTRLSLASNVVVAHKTIEKDGYMAIQLGFGITKKANKPQEGHIKKAGITKIPRFFREIRLLEDSDLTPGSTIKVEEVFKIGDIIDVTGTSKGKGFAGGVKRHHFKGGPRTHGQSDRERAPGSIGQTTTPGRVYKGKRMAGKMGHEQVTVRNLVVLDILEDSILVKGQVPGYVGAVVMVKKVGESKKLVPLFKEIAEGENSPEEAVNTVSEVLVEQKEEAPAEIVENKVEDVKEVSKEKNEEVK